MPQRSTSSDVEGGENPGKTTNGLQQAVFGRGVDGCRGFGCLEDQALVALGPLGAGQERGAGCVLEHLPHALVGLGRALEVFVGTDLLADFLALRCVTL